MFVLLPLAWSLLYSVCDSSLLSKGWVIILLMYGHLLFVYSSMNTLVSFTFLLSCYILTLRRSSWSLLFREIFNLSFIFIWDRQLASIYRIAIQDACSSWDLTGLGWAGLGWTCMWVSWVGDRNLSTWAIITVALQASVLARSWGERSQSGVLNLGTPVWDMGVLDCVFTVRLNVCSCVSFDNAEL